MPFAGGSKERIGWRLSMTLFLLFVGLSLSFGLSVKYYYYRFCSSSVVEKYIAGPVPKKLIII